MVMVYLEYNDICLPIVRNITKKLLLKVHPQISSIKADELINSVHNTFHYAGMAGDMALPSSHVLSLRLCKSAAVFQITP